MKIFNEGKLNLWVIILIIGYMAIGLFINYDVSNGYIANLGGIIGSILILTNYVRYNRMGTISYREYGRNVSLIAFGACFLEAIIVGICIFNLLVLILLSYLVTIEFEFLRKKVDVEVELEDE